MNVSQKKHQISKVKSNALKLRVNYQLPLSLVKFIYNINDLTSENEILFLKEMCEHYLRIKGYYNRYSDIDKQYSEEITKLYQEFKLKAN